ncbi:MAG: phthiocerol/phenolphthiocerol synthesis type-I polyketide synthase E [Alteromonadaceae bacterium]|jgi:phthiocerol/phenolphthiocerol synthesis type-I polyketide synthase E
MESTNGFEIAIVGMSCRFPDAPTVDVFWDNIFDGKDSIRPLTTEELEAAGQLDCVDQPDFVNSGSFLEDTELFDAGLFGYSAKEADYIDPQHRLFLHVAWEALEGAGFINQDDTKSVGVFAGSSSSSYLVHNISKARSSDTDLLRNLCYENNHDLLATRAAYKLNLTGPAITVGSACSTSLVVVHQACQALLAGECDIALAGASRVSVPQKSGYFYAQGGILSKDGKCRSFDAKASGTISGSGVGAIVLRRLEDAIADGDNIVAVIKGTAINNDGNRKVGFTAPSVDGQQQVVVSALQNAEVDAETVSFIEAHGTATELGDPVEVEALSNAYRQFTDKKQYCALGSVKANIGHLDASAGMAGIMKVCGMFQRQQIPPSIHYNQANANIDFEQSPFYVPTSTTPWLSDSKRRAGVSSFGIGGTNAHIILEEYTAQKAPTADHQGVAHSLLTFSASSKEALNNNLTRFHDWCQTHPGENLQNMAYTLASTRKAMAYRAAVSATSVEQAIKKLRDTSSLDIRRSYTKNYNKQVALMFSGQGSQYLGMGKTLYDNETVFQHAVDQCALIIEQELDGEDIRTVMFGSKIKSEDQALINQTQYAQPALFCFEYALSQWLFSKGVTPGALIGHSIGEYVAACIADVMSLADAIKLVCIRGRLMASMQTGAMIAVSADRETIDALLINDVNIAALNAENAIVLSGSAHAINSMRILLENRNIDVKALRTSHAFHSYMMTPCLADFKAAFANIQMRAPRIPIISNITGQWHDNQTITDPQYWIDHLRQPVNFYAGIQTLMQGSEYVLVEVGPGKSLSSLVALTEGYYASTVSLVKDAKSKADDQQVLYDALGDIWCKGGQVNWAQFFNGKDCCKVSLPTYAFNSQKHWLNITEDTTHIVQGSSRNALKDWFYRPVWKSSPRSLSTPRISGKNILFIGANNKYLHELQGLMSAQNNQVFCAEPGKQFNIVNQTIEFQPEISANYLLMLQKLNDMKAMPDLIIHGLQPQDIDMTDHNKAAEIAKFQSLLDLTKALNQVAPLAQVQLCIFTTNMCNTCYADKVDPIQSLVLGPCKTIEKEFGSIRSYFIDIQDNPLQLKDTSVADIFSEISYRFESKEPMQNHGTALRSGQRLIEHQEQVMLEPSSTTDKLKAKGVYLITGGYGGIGATIARDLAIELSATIILISRREIPERNGWSDCLLNSASSIQMKQDIAFIQELESHGAEVFCIMADVSRFDVLSDKLNLLTNNIDNIDGIFHCAGVADSGLIQTRDQALTQRVFAAKVTGTYNLIKIAANYHLDFFFNCSSVSAYLGPVGQVAYCSANSYQQAVSDHYHSQFPMLSVAWDAWQEVGMAVDSLTQQHLERESKGTTESLLNPIAHGITPKEGISVVKTLLSQNFTNVLVSTRALAAVQDWTTSEDTQQDSSTAEECHSRPSLSVEYQPPVSLVQQTLCDIWRKRLGVDPIGIDDDFFELYGHSLLAVQIASDIKRELSYPLPSGALYDYPTVRDLSALIDTTPDKSAPDKAISDHKALDETAVDNKQERVTFEL